MAEKVVKTKSENNKTYYLKHKDELLKRKKEKESKLIANCPHCDFVTKRNWNLNQHIKNKHNLG
jgi:hypothetical protein